MTKDPRKIDFSSFFSLKGKERVEFLLQFAVLAPSTHNSQPWLFTAMEESCELYRDTTLKIPYADPEGRDMYISLGCAIENLSLAAKAFGVSAQVACGPYENNEKVAEVAFDFSGITGEVKDVDILRAICKRINVRGIFKNETVSETFLSYLKTSVYPEYAVEGTTVNFLDEKKDITRFAELTEQAMIEIYHNGGFRAEMSNWMNHGLTRKKTGIPGWALKMPLLASFIIPSIIKYVDMGKKLGSLNKASISSAPLLLVFSATENNERSWLSIGRMAERTMIECFKGEYQTSIFVASIEIGEYYKQVAALAKTTNRPQFILAMGKIDSLHKPTPRFLVHDKMKVI